MDSRNCEWCGGRFQPCRTRQVHCSRKCREKTTYRARFGYPQLRTCNYCGCEFMPAQNKQGSQVYCDGFCRTRATVLSTYSITGPRLFQMLAEQGGLCATGCGTQLSLMVGRGDPATAHVDHDHSCCPRGSCGRCVRGLLCPPCNQALGWIESGPDPIARCEAIASYLLRTKEQQCASK